MGFGVCVILVASFFNFPLAYSATGSVDLYLQNSQLQPNALRNAQNIVYYGVYTIGTPAQRFLGCFDTGSGDTWVPSTQCTSSTCKSHDRYSPDNSSSETVTSTRSTVRYGTGTVNLALIYETTTMGGISLPKQGISLATALTNDFNLVSCDGLVGLSFTELSSSGADTPFINMVKSKSLDANLFALWVSPTPGEEPAGQLTFGRTERSKYSGDITYVPVSRRLYWEVALSGIQVDDTSANVGVTSAIIDSGTTAIVMPTSDAARIHSHIPGAVYWRSMGVYNVTCNIGTLPNVTFQFNGIACSIPPSLYVQALTDSNGNDLRACASAFTGGSQYGSAVVLGSNFLRAWYTVYSLIDNQAMVGFAPSLATPSPSTGGRRRLLQEDGNLFGRTAASLKHPRVGDSDPEEDESPSTAAGRKLQQEQQEPSTLFSRSHASLRYAHSKWNSNNSNNSNSWQEGI